MISLKLSVRAVIKFICSIDDAQFPPGFPPTPDRHEQFRVKQWSYYKANKHGILDSAKYPVQVHYRHKPSRIW